MVATLLALELERARSPEWESEEAAAGFVRAVLAREVTDRGDICARAAELGADLEQGAGVLILRAAPRAAQTEEWRARVLTLAVRSLRSVAPGSLAALEEAEAAVVAVIVPGRRGGADRARRRGARAGAGREPLGLPRDDRPQPPRRRPGRSLPGRQRGAAGGQRRRGRGALAARLRGHRRLPAAAAGDERGPRRARALLRGDDRAARRLRRAVRDRAGADGRGLPRQRRQRRRHRQAAVHPPPHDPLPAGDGRRSSAGTTSRPRSAARSSASASRRCASSASPRPGARRWSRAPRPDRSRRSRSSRSAPVRPVCRRRPTRRSRP